MKHGAGAMQSNTYSGTSSLADLGSRSLQSFLWIVKFFFPSTGAGF